MAADDDQSLDLRRYLAVVHRRSAFILLVALATGLVALVASLLQASVYEAHADILVQPRATESVFSDSQGRSSLNAIETEIEVLSSDPIQDGVRARLGSLPDVSAKRVGETEVMQVTGRSTDAQRAASIANAYAESYVEFRKTEAVGDLEAAGRGIQDKIDELQAEIEELELRISETAPAGQAAIEVTLGPRYSNLLTQQALLAQKLDELQVDADLKSGGARIVRAARVPESPATPKPVRNSLAALGLGLVVGSMAAFVRENFDDSVRSKKQLNQAVGLPVLGLIPAVAGGGSDLGSSAKLVSGDSPAGEAFRTLRTSLQLLGVDRPIGSLQITSPLAGEGKTSIVSGLGIMLAATGQRVVLVDSDLRRPRLHAVFGFANDVGLTSAFVGDVEISAAVRQVPGEQSLFLLPSGPVPTNPSELLSSKRMAELLFALQGEFDMIVVDSAPVLPVTDATLLAAWVEATLLVARADITTERQLAEAVEQLQRVEANLIGTVLNGVKDDLGYGYYDSEHGRSGRGLRNPAPQPG
jgi:non-specific protein-tyrosine kinase